MQSDSYDSIAIQRFAIKLRLVLLARRTIILTAIWLFLAGTVLLILRMSTRLSGDFLVAFIFGALIPIFLAAWLVDRKRIPSLPVIRALFDSFNDCGGLLMATGETSIDPSWLKSFPDLKLPRVAWRWLPSSFLMLSAAIFVAFAVLCPIPVGLKVSSPLEIRAAVEDLHASLEQLEDQAIIESNKVVEIKEELARLEQEATGEDPAKAWEILDNIKDSVTEAAKEALEKNVALSQNIVETQSLIEMALDLQQSNASREMLSDVMRELGDMMKGQDLEALLAGQLPQDLLDAAVNGQLTPEQLEMLAEMLKACNANCQNNLLNLANLKWIEGDFSFCDGKVPGSDTNALLAFLASAKNGSGSMESGLPGRGGVTRGRGDAPMTWQNGTSEEGAGFEEQPLPLSSVNLKDSLLVGISRGTPTAPGQKEAVISGTLAGGEASGDSHSQTILPRHRGAVRRFFDRTEKTE